MRMRWYWRATRTPLSPFSTRSSWIGKPLSTADGGSSALVKLYGVLATVIGTLLTLSTSPTTGGDNECALSSVQTSSIQSATMERNSSCAYNMTVESVLGVV